MGELLGLRISSGHYFRKGFGVLPRAVVWGFLEWVSIWLLWCFLPECLLLPPIWV